MRSEVRRVLREGGILYVNDFLINHDRRNTARYGKYKDKYGTYGVFEIPDGAVLRHHTKNHILGLAAGFRTLAFEETIYTTMNGHPSNGFYYLGWKAG